MSFPADLNEPARAISKSDAAGQCSYGSSNIVAGIYYLAVVGKGQNPSGDTIGTNSSLYSLESFGVQGITNLGPVSATDIWQTNAIQGGENALYQFTIPPGWPAVEVGLSNVTGSPYMTMQTGSNAVSPEDNYGYNGGVSAAWSSSTFITLPNPTATNYSLTVQAAYNSTANAASTRISRFTSGKCPRRWCPLTPA